MSNRRAVQDLKSLILSYHSLITIETIEEERVLSLLHEVATDLRLSLYDWSLTSGFQRVQSSIHVEGTEEPLAALRHIGEIADTDAIFLMKDLPPHLATAGLGRQLPELTQKISTCHST